MHSKKIGLLWVVCITAGAMIGSGLFVLPGPASKEVGSFVFLPYLLASILFIPALLCTCELATAMPKTGGIFYFSDRSMGPKAGMMGGLAFWFSIAAKTAWAFLGLGMFFTLLDPLLPLFIIKSIAITACLGFMAMNLLHMEVAGKFQQYTALGLLVLLVLYLVVGAFFIEKGNITPDDELAIVPMLSTTGLVFVSFSGITWITDMGSEVRNPSRNIPKGIILAWAIVTFIYVVSVLVTVGVLGSKDMSGSVTPLSDGGRMMFGSIGAVIMTVGAVLAFVTTGNAGMLTASRTPYAMSKDRFLPPIFSRTSSKGVPVASVLATGAFMVLILLLPFEAFVRTASSLELITLLMVCMAVIFMREANIKNYRPTFKTPLYPIVPILGALMYGGMILIQGLVPLLMVSLVALGGLGTYFLYSRTRIKADYAALHIVKNILGIRKESHKLNEELREIIIERDGVSEGRFESMLGTTPIVDMPEFHGSFDGVDELSRKVSHHLGFEHHQLCRKMRKLLRNNELMAIPGIMIVPIRSLRERPCKFVVVRTQDHPRPEGGRAPLSYIFVLRWSRGNKNFYLHSIMWLVQLGEGLLEMEEEAKGSCNGSVPCDLSLAWHMKRSRNHYIRPSRFQLDQHPYSAVMAHHTERLRPH